MSNQKRFGKYGPLRLWVELAGLAAFRDGREDGDGGKGLMRCGGAHASIMKRAMELTIKVAWRR